MGQIKGSKEYAKFKNGDKLTRRQAILAQCFICNGEEESNADCKSKLCPLYQFHPHKGKLQADSGSFMSDRIKV